MQLHYIKRIFPLAAAALLTLLLAGCDGAMLDAKGWVTSPSDNVEKRFATSLAYDRSLGLKSGITGFEDGPIMWLQLDTPAYKTAAASDIHILDSINYLIAYSAYVNSMEDFPFALLGGDYIMGSKRFPLFYHAIDSGYRLAQWIDPTLTSPKPMLATIGNHDLFFNQWTEYVDGSGGYEGFHTSTWYTIVEVPEEVGSTDRVKDIFISLDTGSGTLGSKQLAWFRNLAECIINEKENEQDIRHVIIITHTNIFKKDGDQRGSLMPMEETTELMHIFALMGVDLIIQGHDHFREITQYQEVTYLTLDCLKEERDESEIDEAGYDLKSSFCVFDIGEKVEYKFIETDLINMILKMLYAYRNLDDLEDEGTDSGVAD